MRIGIKYWRDANMSSLVQLPDEILIDAYYKAINIELESCFIDLLLGEINRRGLNVSEKREKVMI